MSKKQKILIFAGLIATAVIGRLVPHLWNMTPVAAVAILAGAKLGWRWGMLLPIMAMVIGDLIIGFYSLPILLSVYISFSLAGLVGFWAGKKSKVSAILGGSLFSATAFFLSTNFAVWFFGTMYPHNFYGLIASYIAGLPFFQNQIIGDLFFVSALFASWEAAKWLTGKVKSRQVTEEKIPA